VAGFDVVRGFSVLSMVLFHLSYDLHYLYGMELAWFVPPWRDLWRCSISWAFLCVAGCMCLYARDGLRRGLRYLAVALAVYLATSVVAVDEPISFGIIFCMGACTIVEWVLRRSGMAPQGWCSAVLLAVAFLLCQHLAAGYVGLGPYRLLLPPGIYANALTAAIGLPYPGFTSGDYYPLFPYLLLYLAAAAVGSCVVEKGWPDWFEQLSCPPLAWLGRHALPVYVLHQPILLLALSLALPAA
jgi:uncharacterized membrane protein